MKREISVLGLFLIMAVLAGCVRAQSVTSQESPARRREVAITFDDLPGVSMVRSQRCNLRAFEDVNGRLLKSLDQQKVPALGLVVESRLCGGDQVRLPALLKMWLDAGHELGNHSYSHFDLNNTPLELYQSDVIRGEAVTKRLLEERGRKLKYFRHPFLHAGKDMETKRAFESFLASRGYELAPVTIDNQEWVFAEVYARALQARDAAMMKSVKTAYLKYMEEIFGFFEKRSVEVVGYEVKQVLLLHVNPLNADCLDELIGMIRRRGYAFITVEQALADPAYRLPDTYAGPQGLSWIHRWAVSKGMQMREEMREPESIAALFKNYFPAASGQQSAARKKSQR